MFCLPCQMSRVGLTVGWLVLFALSGTVLLFPASLLRAQDDEAPADRREFRNPDGQTLAIGTLMGVDGNKVLVATSEGTSELRLNSLCPEDKVWIRELLKRRKLEQEAELVQGELQEAGISGKSHLVYKSLRKLRPYGANARLASSLLLNLLKKDFLDQKTRQEVLLTYLDTSPLNAEQAEKVLAVIAAEWDLCGPLISADPSAFLQTYARFGDWSTDYLTTVAYTGELKPNPRVAPPTSPRNSDLADGTLIRNRASAVRALAELKTERSLEIILEILALVERPNPGKPELDAQKTCLEAISVNGLSNAEVTASLERLAKSHPELVAKVREKLAAKSDK